MSDSNAPASPPNGASRTLAAIVFTDAVGFSAKMQRDEIKSLAILREDIDYMIVMCEKHGGNVLKTMGDSVMMRFSSAIHAVNCAIEIQRALFDRNRRRPPQDRMLHRIGIHLGDVIETGNDVMGDGVNIASRLEPLAAPGGIAMSQTVYDVVRQHIPVRAWDDGLKKLKNIEQPVNVFQIYPPNPTGAIGTKGGADSVIIREDSGNRGWLIFGGIAATILLIVIGFAIMATVLRDRGSEPRPPDGTIDTGPVTNNAPLNQPGEALAPEKPTTEPAPPAKTTISVFGSFDVPRFPLDVPDLSDIEIAELDQVRRTALMQYKPEDISSFVSQQLYATLPVGTQLKRRYENMAELLSFANEQMSLITKQRPLRITVSEGGNSQEVLIYSDSSGALIAQIGQEEQTGEFVKIRPQVMVPLLLSLIAGSPTAPSHAGESIRNLAQDYGVPGG
jgi:class 3 adenylate cyclase